VSGQRTWEQRRKRTFEVVEIGAAEDALSRGYDFFSTFIVVVNLAVSIAYTYDNLRAKFGPWMEWLELFTVIFFTVDYALRLWTAKYLRQDVSEGRAVWKYMISFTGIVDLLSFLPYYLPALFPVGMAAFRMFRVVRIFRLFRINAYYDSFHVITEVIVSKRQQLLSSVFIILVLMLASSLCMYSLEHEAQPEVFANAFSGVWWSVSTLLTVGYGDIYPITTLGKIFGIGISFLGVGMVAIPTGIISAGFVDQYSRVKRSSEYASEAEVRFIRVGLTAGDDWVGKTIRELDLPHGVLVALVQRGREMLTPQKDLTLRQGDALLLGAESATGDQQIELKEVELRHQSAWNGQRVGELDISRKTILLLVKRKNKLLEPKDDLVLREGDRILLYTRHHLPDADNIYV
jgi:voltage-gated potassium channel